VTSKAEICPSYTESSQTRTHIKTQAKSNSRALSILPFAKIECGPVSDRPWCDSGRPTLNIEACIRRPLFVFAPVSAPHHAQASLSSLHDHAHTPASENTYPCLEDGMILSTSADALGRWDEPHASPNPISPERQSLKSSSQHAHAYIVRTPMLARRSAGGITDDLGWEMTRSAVILIASGCELECADGFRWWVPQITRLTDVV